MSFTEITETKDEPWKGAGSNKEYGESEYWDDRFAQEPSYEWLLTFKEVATQITPFFKSSDKILVVGCGNSDFSADLYDAGFTNVVNVDFSSIVIENMREKNQDRPEMEWKVMDMTDMAEFEDGSFDHAIDKAAMDALMSQEGDVWNPDEDVIDKARSMCRHISRILKPGGYHFQISFQQPHFRKKHLLGWHGAAEDYVREEDASDEFDWSFRVESIGGESGCFEDFLYIMQKNIPVV